MAILSSSIATVASLVALKEISDSAPDDDSVLVVDSNSGERLRGNSNLLRLESTKPVDQ